MLLRLVQSGFQIFQITAQLEHAGKKECSCKIQSVWQKGHLHKAGRSDVHVRLGIGLVVPVFQPRKLDEHQADLKQGDLDMRRVAKGALPDANMDRLDSRRSVSSSIADCQ